MKIENFGKLSISIIKSIIGAALLTAGILCAIFLGQGVMPALPFVLGSMGLFGLLDGLNHVFISCLMKKSPDMKKELHDFYDERAVAIENKAKAKVGDLTSMFLWASIIFLAIMQVQLLIIWVFVGAVIVRAAVMAFLVKRYDKEM